MRPIRAGLVEAVRALCALALLFFVLAQAPVASAAGTQPGYGLAGVPSYCGGPPGDTTAHGPCHACRFGVATVPPPCDGFIPAFGHSARVTYTRHAALRTVAPGLFSPQPRGPPAA